MQPCSQGRICRTRFFEKNNCHESVFLILLESFAPKLCVIVVWLRISLFSIACMSDAQGVETMEQGLTVLVVGITTVFAFLVLLVAVMQASTWFFGRFAHLFPEPSQTVPATGKDDLSEIAVVIAALRARNR